MPDPFEFDDGETVDDRPMDMLASYDEMMPIVTAAVAAAKTEPVAATVEASSEDSAAQDPDDAMAPVLNDVDQPQAPNWTLWQPPSDVVDGRPVHQPAFVGKVVGPTPPADLFEDGETDDRPKKRLSRRRPPRSSARRSPPRSVTQLCTRCLRCTRLLHMGFSSRSWFGSSSRSSTSRTSCEPQKWLGPSVPGLTYRLIPKNSTTSRSTRTSRRRAVPRLHPTSVRARTGTTQWRMDKPRARAIPAHRRGPSPRSMTTDRRTVAPRTRPGRRSITTIRLPICRPLPMEPAARCRVQRRRRK